MIFNVSGGSGGSAGLNFKIIGATSMPSNPKENDIWVNTSDKITDWVFSVTQPTSATGRVWISVGTSSIVEFNALKKNGIQVYPISVKQYTNGAWKDVTAKSYQNGKWRDWWDGSVIYGDNKYTEIVGEWKTILGDTGQVTWGTDGVTLTYTGNVGRHASIYGKNPIDVTSYKTLRATVTKAVGTTANNIIGVRKSPTTSTSITDYASGYAAYATVPASDNEQIINIDISNLSGDYYVQLASGIATLTVKRLQFIS